MKLKKLVSLALVGVMTLSLAACSSGKTGKSNGSSGGDDKKSYHVIYLTPSTASQFWTYVGIGIENAMKDIEEKEGIEVDYEVVGPAEESQTEECYYCSNDTIGEMAAQAFKDAMDQKGITDGVLGMNTNVENEALNHRIDGFRSKIKELAPQLTLTDTYYNGNDVETAQKNAENIISTYGDKLIGMYSGNNITGDGVCNAVADSNVGDKFINVAVDSDDIEIQALKNGVLDAIIVQDAYAQGYKCMENALQTLITGKNPESKKQVNCPPVVITKDNMEQSDMQDLLDTTRLKK